MHRHATLFLLSIAVLSILTCRKEDKLSSIITGRVVETTFGLPIEGANVLLQVNDWVNGEDIQLTLEELETDWNGEFSFNRSAGYEFVNAEKDGYYFKERDQQTTSGVDHIEITLTGRSWLELHILNSASSAPEDMIRVQPRFEGASPAPHIFYGADVDEHLKGEIKSNHLQRISWLTFINDEHQWHNMEVSAIPNDTISLLISY